MYNNSNQNVYALLVGDISKSSVDASGYLDWIYTPCSFFLEVVDDRLILIKIPILTIKIRGTTVAIIIIIVFFDEPSSGSPPNVVEDEVDTVVILTEVVVLGASVLVVDIMGDDWVER
jgi:hypothetical protein